MAPLEELKDKPVQKYKGTPRPINKRLEDMTLTELQIMKNWALSNARAYEQFLNQFVK